jgi:hypothetical protein
MSKNISIIVGFLFLGMGLQCGAEALLLELHVISITPSNSLMVGTLHFVVATLFFISLRKK